MENISTEVLSLCIRKKPYHLMQLPSPEKRSLPWRILYHSLYWILNVLFFTVHFASRNDFKDFDLILKENIAYLPGGMLFTYFSVYYLLPKFFFKNKILLYILLQIAVFLLYPVVSGIVTVQFVNRYIDVGTTHFTLASHISTIMILIMCIVPFAAVQIARRLIFDSNVKRDLEKKKVEVELKFKEAELKLLKAQIHPHFLFNTLNNLYSLAIEKSDKTPEVIIKISDMLSYIIYDCNAEKVSLEKEVEFINSYISLEKLRYDENLNITVSISGDLANKAIAPMILHAFIENSFKHGASNDVGSPWITLDLKITGNKLNFTIANSKVIPDTNQPTGIGIENVKKRLQLLYPGRHHLDISDDEGVFSVELEIDL